jgi:5-methylcytosine-specific restriction endonuclease McrA
MPAKGFRSTHCKRGHALVKENVRVNTRGERQCSTCKNNADAKFRRNPKNKIRIAKAKRKYYDNNIEVVKQRANDWNAAHREKVNKWHSLYKKKYPEKDRAQQARRRAKKTQAGGYYTQEEWFALCVEYNNRCACCNKRRKLTADHVVPIAKGGTSWITNIQPLCGPCNRHKSTKTTDYRTQK